jgi:hypothetical protein
VSVDPTTLLLPAALVDPAWLGAARLAELAGSPGWSALARRARILETSSPDVRMPPDPGHDRWLQRRLGLPADCALAACAVLDRGPLPAHWRLDPVHLHVGRDHLVLTDPAELALDPADALALAGAVAPLFADEGLLLTTSGPTRWALRETDPARPLRLSTRALLGALGRSIEAWQPTGDDARRWRRLVNEVQMTWFEHPVNAARESVGRPSVNSLWIEGRCPDPENPALTPAWIDAARRLASRERRASLPAPALDVDDGHGTLRVDDRLLEAQFSGDPLRWSEAWRALDISLFQPIARGEAPWQRDLQLVLAGDAGWRTINLSKRTEWRFWRRADPAALLAETAVSDAERA